MKTRIAIIAATALIGCLLLAGVPVPWWVTGALILATGTALAARYGSRP